MTPPVLQTDRLILRPPSIEDADAVIAFYQGERSAMAGGHVSRPEAVTRYLAVLGHWSFRGYGLFAMVPRGQTGAIGLAGPYFPPGRPETEIGWVLFDGYEGQGFATEAARATMRFARDDLGWNSVVHYIDSQNTRSIKLAERLGAALDEDAEIPVRSSRGQTLVYRQPEVSET